MKKILVMLFAVAMLAAAGCGKYTSSWNATMMIQSAQKTKSSMKFSTFEGKMVYKLKCDDPSKKIVATATLGSGKATVYYDYDDNKEEFFKVSDGDVVEYTHEGLKEGTVYIIIESDGKCINGNFSFSIE